MKTKTLNKKLALSKSTIANLNNSGMKAIYGGATLINTECRTVCVTNCLGCTKVLSDCIC
jgi:hypothetical protein